VARYASMDATSIGFDASIKWFFDGQERVYDPTVAYEMAEPPFPYIYAPGRGSRGGVQRVWGRRWSYKDRCGSYRYLSMVL
jgi:hypothetical protein